ncbi:MAG: T9SS type A sorting domain-containing protein, partial [Ignavibacteria bacterium]
MFNYVQLIIFDILGREITTLVNEQLTPGTYEIEWNALKSPSGVYYYKLSAGDFTETKKMVLLK